MNKQLLSILSLSLLISFAPGCKEKSKKKKTVKKIDILDSEVLENETRAWAQADTDDNEEEVIPKF